MSDNKFDHEEIKAIRNEIEKIKRRSRISLTLAILSLAFAIVFCLISLQPKNANTIATVPIVPTNTISQPQDANFQNVTAKSIKIFDDNNNLVATIGPRGILLDGPLVGLTITTVGKKLVDLDDIGLELNSIDGQETSSLSPGLLSNTSTGGAFGTASLSVSPASVYIQTGQNYVIDLGSIFGAGDLTAGLYIYNTHYSKTNADGSPTDQTSATFSPENISLTDASGVERVSVGKTQLTIPSTGANQTTALSSIVLFDTSGHVTWQTP